MTISQRIFSILKQKNKKQKDLADFTGISTSAISAWNKNNTSPAAEKLSIIADFLEVSLDYLLTGKEKSTNISNDVELLVRHFSFVDNVSKKLILERAQTLAELEKERQAAEQAAKATEPETAQNIHMATPTAQKFNLPYYDMPASAGTGLFLDDSHSHSLAVNLTEQSASADYVLRVSGDSMEPDFYNNDLVLVKSCPRVDIGQIGIFVLDGDAFIKEYGGDCLISHNPLYKPLMLKSYDMAVCLGRVLGIADLS